MKKSVLFLLFTALSINAFSHPGHHHDHMVGGELLGHLLWIIVPVIAFIVVWAYIKHRKKQNV